MTWQVDLDREKRNEKIRSEFENRQVENPMGIATWPDLATQNAIEKHYKNKCRPKVWGIQIRTIWAGHLFSLGFSIVLVECIFSSVCHRNVVRSKSGHVSIPMGFSTW